MRTTLLAVAAFLFGQPGRAAEPITADVAVYGATPAGIAAALAAARQNQRVVLIEPTARVGGLVTSGLSHTDFISFEGLTGAYLQFAQRVAKHYEREFGADSPQAKGNFRGTHGEPKVNLAVFEAMIAAQPKIKLLTRHALVGTDVADAGKSRAIKTVRLTDAAGLAVTVAAHAFIDGSYEGDLMAAAKVAYRVGREGQREYGEPLAPPEADGQVQAYNFRLVVTDVPSNRAPVPAPPGYRRDDFAGVLSLFADGRLVSAFGYSREKAIFKLQPPPLPNGKYDLNDMSGGLVRLSLGGRSGSWPEGDAAARRAVFDEHLRWNVGLLHFLQTDEAVPEPIRAAAGKYGLCKDEFAETGHLPPQLYVREARRMVGVHVFTQNDCRPASGDARAVLHRDAIAIGEYGLNCHGTEHEGARFGGKHTGEFYAPVPPYQIPYGVLVPRDVTNLLVPGAASASHVGFCALRLEPIWMNLGDAAGRAAALAVSGEVSMHDVPTGVLQEMLHQSGAATTYVSDVPQGHPDFAAVQWWATAGGLHGLHPPPKTPGQRGKRIVSQYH